MSQLLPNIDFLGKRIQLLSSGFSSELKPNEARCFLLASVAVQVLLLLQLHQQRLCVCVCACVRACVCVLMLMWGNVIVVNTCKPFFPLFVTRPLFFAVLCVLCLTTPIFAWQNSRRELVKVRKINEVVSVYNRIQHNTKVNVWNEQLTAHTRCTKSKSV